MRQRLLDYLHTLLNPEAYGLGTIAVELILIGVVVYAILRFLQGTRGARLLQGIAILLVVGFLVMTLVAEQFHLDRIEVLFRPLVWTIFLTALVVFQPELRRGLMRLGETRWRRDRLSEVDQVARPVATACAKLSKNKIGALIAIERDVGLSGLAEQGVKLDAKLTPELLDAIFYPGSALHDMGVIVQGGRVAAAGCPFPLGDAEGLDSSIGSRHRAAIGLSLDSDAVIVVVSEETGAISIAENGRLHRHILPDTLQGLLRRHLARIPVSTRGWMDEPQPPPTPPRTSGIGPHQARSPSSAGEDDAVDTPGERENHAPADPGDSNEDNRGEQSAKAASP